MKKRNPGPLRANERRTFLGFLTAAAAGMLTLPAAILKSIHVNPQRTSSSSVIVRPHAEAVARDERSSD